MSEKKDKKSKKKVINNILLIVIFMLLSYLFISGIQSYIGYFRKYNISVDNETLKYIEKESKIIDANMKKIKNMKSNNLSEEDIRIININLNKIYKYEKDKIKMVKSNKKYSAKELYYAFGLVEYSEETTILSILENNDIKLNYYKGLLKEKFVNNASSAELLMEQISNNSVDESFIVFRKNFQLYSLRNLTEFILEAGDNNE